jgi:hypothetical protein
MFFVKGGSFSGSPKGSAEEMLLEEDGLPDFGAMAKSSVKDSPLPMAPCPCNSKISIFSANCRPSHVHGIGVKGKQNSFSFAGPILKLIDFVYDFERGGQVLCGKMVWVFNLNSNLLMPRVAVEIPTK